MERNGLLIGEAIAFGWETVRKRGGLLIGAMLFAGLFNLTFSGLQNLLTDHSMILGGLLAVAAGIFNLLVQMGLLKIVLKTHDGEEAVLADLFSQGALFLSFLAASLLYSLMVIGGLLLFVVPGIVWGITFAYGPWLVVDRGLPPLEALRESARITRGYRWELFLLALLKMGINILGLLACCLGLVLSVPVTMLATAHIYRRLLRIDETARTAWTPVPTVPQQPAAAEAPAPALETVQEVETPGPETSAVPPPLEQLDDTPPRPQAPSEPGRKEDEFPGAKVD